MLLTIPKLHIIHAQKIGKSDSFGNICIYVVRNLLIVSNIPVFHRLPVRMHDTHETGQVIKIESQLTATIKLEEERPGFAPIDLLLRSYECQRRVSHVNSIDQK